MQTQRIVMLGGTGFVGRRLVARLQRDGHRIDVLSRNRERHRALAVLPRVRVTTTDVHDRSALERRLAGADVAINLVGVLNERGNDGRGFARAHVTLTAHLLDACAVAGVGRLLQMSALRSGEGDSFYLKTRGTADARVQASALAWTLLRPSVIFGPGDGLFCRFASLLRWLPVLPLARADARFSPVYVGDVADAFACALEHPHTSGRIYDLVGPRTIALGELVRWTATLLGLRRLVLPLPDALGAMQARIGEWLPGKPISRDNFKSLKLDSTSADDGLAMLGIVATPMELVVPSMLRGDGPQSRLDRFRARH